MSIVIRRSPRLFEDTYRPGYRVQESENTLAVDVRESDNAYTLHTNLPGVSADNIEITLHDGVLNISAELIKPEADEGERMLMQERAYGRYSRALRLPKAVDSNEVEAAFENGVLVLTLPKTPEAQPRQIPIRTNGTLHSNN